MNSPVRRSLAVLCPLALLLLCLRFPGEAPRARHDARDRGAVSFKEAGSSERHGASSVISKVNRDGQMTDCPHCAGGADPSPASLVLSPDFIANLAASPTKGKVSFGLPDGRTAVGVVEMKVPGPSGGIDGISGRLLEPGAGRFFFQRERLPGVAHPLSGTVEIFACNTAYQVETGGAGESHLAALPADAVVCRGMAVAEKASSGDEELPSEHPANIPIPGYQNGVVPLQSLPGAAAVAYLDFDGEPGPHFYWGNFDAASYNFSNFRIKNIWVQVAEDFAPFNINITTDLAVYLAAPLNSRQRCIITPTKDAAPTAGGVANIGSFNNSSEVSCWAYNDNDDEICAMTISHELGHTLLLRHDGRTSPQEEYYDGHGTSPVSWGPIMGSPFFQNLTQWSKGEYAGASRAEDDLAIIAGSNNSVDDIPDDSGTTIATARYLEIQGTGNAASGQGIIGTNGDADGFRFRTTATGITSLTVKPVTSGPNLDVLAEIVNAAGSVLAMANPSALIDATVSASLPAGEYLLRVSGTGRGNPLVDGYTSYGSLGAYSITGTVANAVKPDRFTIAETAMAGANVGTVIPKLSHGTNPLQYSIQSGNGSGAFSIDPATGQLRVADPAALDYETLVVNWLIQPVFELFVELEDLANSSLDELLRVVVTVSNVNEKPVFAGGSVLVPERLRAGSTVFTVVATDPDRYDFPATYQIVSGNTGGHFTISAEGVISIATPPEVTGGGTFNLGVRVTDDGSPSASTTATVTVNLIDIPAGLEPGGTYRTIYDGISGSTLASLTGSSSFPDDPDREVFLTSLADSARGSTLGSTIRSYLIAPYAGDYTFWIAGDDACQLLFSTDQDPAHATPRASNSTAVGQLAWDATPAQKSAAIPLVAGQVCYLECRQKQNSGSEHIGVAWSAVSGGGTLIPREVVPGTFLAPHSINYRPRIVTTSLGFFENLAPGNAVGLVKSGDLNPGQTHEYSITGGSGQSFFSIRAEDGLVTIPDPLLLDPSASYTLEVTAKDDGTPALTKSGVIAMSYRPMGPQLAGLMVASNPVAAGSTAGSGVYRRGETVPISVTPAAGESFQQWTGGALAPASASTATVLDNPAPGVAGANFLRMSLANRTAPLPPGAAANDLTWSLLGSGHDMDIVDESVEGGIGSGEALRIDGSTGNNRGLLATWANPVALEIGDTLSFTVDARYHEAPAANASGLIMGLTSSTAKDQAFSIRFGTGGTAGFQLVRDVINDSSPGSGTFANLAATVAGTAPASLATEPFTVVFSIHRSAVASFTIGAAINGTTATAISPGWASYDSFFIRNGAINADFTTDNILVSRSSAKKLTANFLSADPFAAWITGYPLAGANATRAADPDGDGLSNFTEMHLGFSPVDASSRLELSIAGIQGGTARLIANRLVTDGSFQLQWSAALNGAWEGSQVIPVSADAWNVELPVSVSGPRHFFRLTYEPPP